MAEKWLKWQIFQKFDGVLDDLIGPEERGAH